MSKLSIPLSAEDHIQGDPAAECILVEYGDYQCPSCGEAYPIVQNLETDSRLSFAIFL
jgi:protein-disulfide isomerase